MQRKSKILTQEEYSEIQAEITKLKMEQALTGKDNSKKINELTDKIS